MIDQLDSVGAIEDRVGHRLAHAHARDLRDDVVQALDVLDVDRGVDVDAVLEQLLDVEIALRMPAARRVGVRELVDKHDLRPTGDDGVEVHLLQPPALVFDALARNDFEPLQQRLRLLAAMRLDDADDDIVAVALARARRLQHRIGLADAGRRADENLELADAALLLPGSLQQGFGRGPLVDVAPLFRHHGVHAARLRIAGRSASQLATARSLVGCDPSWSSARLSSSTFTRRSGVRKPPGENAAASISSRPRTAAGRARRPRAPPDRARRAR